MRKLALIFASLIFLMLPATAAVATVADLVKGVNGMVTAPLDPFFGAIDGITAEDRLAPDLGPVNNVTDAVQGAIFGIKDGVVRAVTGAGDVITFLFTEEVGGPWSPDARYDVTEAVRNILAQVPGLDKVLTPVGTPTE